MGEMISDALLKAGHNLFEGFATVLPRVLALVTIVLVGWVGAALLRLLTRRLLRWMRFNALFERGGAADLLKRAELPPPDVMAGSMVFWLVWIGFLLSGVTALGFSAMHTMVQEFFSIVPRLLVALVILAAGLLLANFAWRATLLAAVNAGLSSGRPLGAGVRLLVIVLTVAMALDQLGIARAVVLTAFAIGFGSIMLSLAIAFGIGGGKVAGRLLERQLEKREDKDTRGTSHL